MMRQQKIRTIHDTCSHERSHIVDSRFYGANYSTSESKKIFCDICRLKSWMRVEVVLAEAQGELGIIPNAAAIQIAKEARIEAIDLEEIAAEVKRTGHSLIPLIRAMQKASGEYAGEYVHFGATTQDIQDTAQSMEMGEVLNVLESYLSELVHQLVSLASEHIDQTMVARTHSVAALPTTFGLKVAGWIDELLRHEERMRVARTRVTPVQLFGGVGTMAGLGDKSIELLNLFAKKLTLPVPLLGWHCARDRIAEFVSLLAMISSTLARIADEIRTLSRPEIGELKLAWHSGMVGSSTMPHKRNPEECEQIVVMARLAKSQVPLALEAMGQEHERDYRGTRLEWCAIADVSHYTLAAMNLLIQLIAGLAVQTERMKKNALNAAEQICTEALMLKLGKSIGKQSAHALIYELSQKAQSNGSSLKLLAKEHPVVLNALDGSENVEKVFDPTQHLGESHTLVRRVLMQAAEGRRRFSGRPIRLKVG